MPLATLSNRPLGAGRPVAPTVPRVPGGRGAGRTAATRTSALAGPRAVSNGLIARFPRHANPSAGLSVREGTESRRARSHASAAGGAGGGGAGEDDLKEAEAASAAAERAAASSQELASTLFLGMLFALWYGFNIYFNIFNKQVLKAFPRPLTVTAFQFLVGGVVALLSWVLGLHPRPDPRSALAASPLSAIHCLGNALTNVSLGAVAVSFTHTIKALEPLFSVALSAAFLNDPPSLPVALSLLPIIGGVALASTGELGFNWTGFLSAMGSNLTFQSRNVLSKRVLGGMTSAARKPDGTPAPRLDNVNLFSVITIVSFFLLAPIAWYVEGPMPLSASALRAAGIADPALFARRSVAAALCFHAYQQVSYAILARVSPVSHAVGNCVKRVVVILASLVVFRNPLTAQSAAGTAIALGGVFGYSSAKRRSGKAKKS